MPVTYAANTIQTVYAHLSGTAESRVVSTKLDDEGKTTKRGVHRRMFSGCVVYNDHASNDARTVSINITDGTTSYRLDRTTIQKGDSAVWSEEEYGVELGSDQYVDVLCESIHVLDDLYVFIRLRDIA